MHVFRSPSPLTLSCHSHTEWERQRAGDLIKRAFLRTYVEDFSPRHAIQAWMVPLPRFKYTLTHTHTEQNQAERTTFGQRLFCQIQQNYAALNRVVDLCDAFSAGWLRLMAWLWAVILPILYLLAVLMSAEECERGRQKRMKNNNWMNQQQSNPRLYISFWMYLCIRWYLALLPFLLHVQQVIDVCLSICSHSQGQSKCILST